VAALRRTVRTGAEPVIPVLDRGPFFPALIKRIIPPGRAASVLLDPFVLGRICPMAGCSVWDAFDAAFDKTISCIILWRGFSSWTDSEPGAAIIFHAVIPTKSACEVGAVDVPLLTRPDFQSLVISLYWHQRRNITPQHETSERPSRSPNPWLCTTDILDHHRNVPTGSRARFTLNAETSIEQAREVSKHLAGFVRTDRRRFRLRERPWHRHIRKLLAWRRRDNQRRVSELRTMQRENVLDHQLRGIAMLAVDVLLDIEADDVVIFGQTSFSPTTETCVKIHQKRLGQSNIPPDIETGTATRLTRTMRHHAFTSRVQSSLTLPALCASNARACVSYSESGMRASIAQTHQFEVRRQSGGRGVPMTLGAGRAGLRGITGALAAS
jgi:hypothetical protein